MAVEITEEFVWQNIPPRARDSHKGTFGSVLAVAGSAFYRGAALLAAEGALRTGAGIVTLASVEPVVGAAVTRLPECCLCPCKEGAQGGIAPENVPLLRRQKATVLLLGPGLGGTAQSAARATETRTLVQQLLPGFAGAAVLDADGLNAAAQLLAEGKPFPHPAGELVVTPHPGEMARLTGFSAAELAADREGIALRYAKAWNAVVVLKGARTVVASPDGRVCVNPTGNPGLARGGSGDVLAGMLAALLACGLPAYQAAACAVYLHGAAADRAAAKYGEYGMLPHEILPELGADAIGVNCSNGPDLLDSVVRGVKAVSPVPVLAKPNAGLPVMTDDGRAVYSMGPEAFAGHMKALIDTGASLLGGCCGTTPAHIQALKAIL